MVMPSLFTLIFASAYLVVGTCCVFAMLVCVARWYWHGTAFADHMVNTAGAFVLTVTFVTGLLWAYCKSVAGQ